MNDDHPDTPAAGKRAAEAMLPEIRTAIAGRRREADDTPIPATRH